MSQVSFSPEVTLANLADYIRKDGTTTTTARIPFNKGIFIPTGTTLPNDQSIRIGSNPSPNNGYTSQLQIWADDLSFNNQFIFQPSEETVGTFGADVYFYGGVAPSGGFGGSFVIEGGTASGAGSRSGSSSLVGGTNTNATGRSGSVFLKGGVGSGSNTRGYVRVAESGTTSRFTLTSNDARLSLYVEKNFEVDGTGWFDGPLNVAGATTLASSLTGILKATSGLVATASSADLLTAIGTIDISSNTNLAVSSPITLTGDTVGFDFNTNNTWGGTQRWNNTATVADDTKLYLGHNGGGFGNVSLWMDAGGTGNLRLEAENTFSGAWEIFPDYHSLLVSVGGSLASPIINPTGTSDAFSVRKQSSSSAIRAMVVQSEWNGTSTSANAIQGQNIFVSTSTSATGSLTGSNALRANRAVVRHRATSAGATVANAIASASQIVMDAGTAAMTNGYAVNIEAPSIGLASTLTSYYGLYIASGGVSGTITNNYQAFIQELSAGTNRYELWMDGGGGIFFRAGTQQIYSSAASTLDFDSATTINARIGGTTEFSISSSLIDIPSNDLALASDKRIYFEGGSGDTYMYYDSASSSVKLYVNAVLAAEFK